MAIKSEFGRHWSSMAALAIRVRLLCPLGIPLCVLLLTGCAISRPPLLPLCVLLLTGCAISCPPLLLLYHVRLPAISRPPLLLLYHFRCLALLGAGVRLQACAPERAHDPPLRSHRQALACKRVLVRGSAGLSACLKSPCLRAERRSAPA